ncbi:hypothetical protein AVEN_231085-1 [Araneus ventricosus]|uniref:Uncharacterized protein n=1 Tax=Araneus ventricosus TaxID=182803 RepID=A0A4Y2TXJ3_ARAVE|nr:hypothetical protein AVEN_231085-1 [Araneus ventricosus]
MEPVHVYLPPNVPVPSCLQNAHDAQLVLLQKDPKECALIERERDCACDSSHRIVVKDRCIIIPKDEHVVSAFPCYAIPKNCTPDELVTIITWITRHRFMTFEHEIEKGNFDRYIAPNNAFYKKSHPWCELCEEHYLKAEPVFCMKQIVLSAQNKGPTVESVL